MHWLSHFNVIENEILAFFIPIMCDEEFHHTLRASVIALKCDKKYHILSVLIITKKFDVSLITVIMRCSLHFQRQCRYPGAEGPRRVTCTHVHVRHCTRVLTSRRGRGGANCRRPVTIPGGSISESYVRPQYESLGMNWWPKLFYS